MHGSFTLEAARRILPEVRRLLEIAVQARAELGRIRDSMEEFSARASAAGGMSLAAAVLDQWQTSVRRESARMRSAVDELESIGVQVKDLEIGLVDFPMIHRGRQILLCWRLGEPDIAWWHAPEEGFRGRKPIGADFESLF